jgi:arylsulfatase A-like enzyme
LRPFLDGDLEGLQAPEGWRQAVHHEFDFREPTSSIIEEIFGVRQDQCAISVLRTRERKLVEFCADLPPLFFDLEADPGELVDLAGDPARSTELLAHTRALLRLRMEHTDPRLANTRATALGTVHRADPPRP